MNLLTLIPSTWEQWFKAVATAAISGGVSAGLAALGISAGNALGLEHVQQLESHQFWHMVGSGALVGVFMYLKQSPLPSALPAQPVQPAQPAQPAK